MSQKKIDCYENVYETTKDWWDGISLEQQQAIDQSIIKMNEGKVTLHEEVMKKYEKWQNLNSTKNIRD